MTTGMGSDCHQQHSERAKPDVSAVMERVRATHTHDGVCASIARKDWFDGREGCTSLEGIEQAAIAGCEAWAAQVQQTPLIEHVCGGDHKCVSKLW